MKLDDLLLNINATGFNSIVCQTDIKTEEDKNTYNRQGYHIQLTEDEFKSRFEIDPNHIWYTPSLSMLCFYFNKESLAAAPFHIELFLVEEQGQSMGLDVKTMYKAIQNPFQLRGISSRLYFTTQSQQTSFCFQHVFKEESTASEKLTQ